MLLGTVSMWMRVLICIYCILHVFQIRISKGDHQQRSHFSVRDSNFNPSCFPRRLDRAASQCSSQCVIPIGRAHLYFRTNKWVIFLYNSARHIIYINTHVYVLVFCKNQHQSHWLLSWHFFFCPPRRPLIQTSASNGTSEASVLHRCVETEWMDKTEVTKTGN